MDNKKIKIINIAVIIFAIVVPFGLSVFFAWRVVKKRMENKNSGKQDAKK